MESSGTTNGSSTSPKTPPPPPPQRPPLIDRSTEPQAQSANEPQNPVMVSSNLIRDRSPPGHPTTSDERFQRSENDVEQPDLSSEAMAHLVTKVPTSARYDPEYELKSAGKRRVLLEKCGLIAALTLVNFFFVFATWWFPRYYYVYLPFITLTVVLNSIMVFSILFFSMKHKLFPEKVVIPETPERLVFVVPCYNETPEELTRSLDSLVNQTKIDDHPKAIIIICDGKVRGPGMQKTTAEYLFDDVLIHRKSRRYMKAAYIAWTHETMDVEIQSGIYKGLPYACIVKQQNQGKRDSLIVIRSFLHKFNLRAERPTVIFSPEFFGEMASFLAVDAALPEVTYLIGMDADTVFAEDCISELLKESRYPGTVGVCGYVAVDFSRNRWGLWSLYQSTEYSISQGLRRLHQSIVTNKVSCLPGCCQLLRVCETTCGDRVLIDLFGYCPKPTDSLIKHIRSTASEDRNHVCLMLSAFPKAQTRQALKARAFTDVPQSWSVFLSQRRRWTLGATSNDVLLISSPGIYWFERILAFANCLVWFVNVFVFASVANLIKASVFVDGWIILSFSAVMLIPVTYYLCIVIWLPRTICEKVQYLIGLPFYLVGGPFINIFVLLYAVYNVDSFGWGKTRMVVSEVAAVQNVTVPVPVPADEEADIGLRQEPRPTSRRDTVIILGRDRNALQLCSVFSKDYRTVLYDPSEEVLSRLREEAYGMENNHVIETTSDTEQLATAKIFLMAAPAIQQVTGWIPHRLQLEEAKESVAHYVKPGDIVMVEGTVPVGKTRSLLEGLERRGAFCGFSPTQSSDSIQRIFTSTNKVISALSDDSLRQIEGLYRRAFANTLSVATPEIAELLHFLETAVLSQCLERTITSDPQALQYGQNLEFSFKMMSAMWKKSLNDECGLPENLAPFSDKVA